YPCILVNKFWNAIATKYLWRIVILRSTTNYNLQIGQLTSTLTNPHSLHNYNAMPKRFEIRRNVMIPMSLALTMSYMPGLSELELSYLELKQDIFIVIMRSTPQLQHVFLSYCRFYPRAVSTPNKESLQFWPCLQTLELNGIHFDSELLSWL